MRTATYFHSKRAEMEDEGKMEMNYLSQKRDCIIFIEG